MNLKKLLASAIPLDIAIQQAANWRKYCAALLSGQKGNHNEELPVIKAFYIPKIDLDTVMELAKNDSGKDVVGLRVYFRLENESDDLSNLKAMIVPVIYDQSTVHYLTDWTHYREAGEDKDSSLVFDFTRPCPTECDLESPLI